MMYFNTMTKATPTPRLAKNCMVFRFRVALKCMNNKKASKKKRKEREKGKIMLQGKLSTGWLSKSKMWRSISDQFIEGHV
jgi:hypothetical protein